MFWDIYPPLTFEIKAELISKLPLAFLILDRLVPSPKMKLISYLSNQKGDSLDDD